MRPKSVRGIRVAVAPRIRHRGMLIALTLVAAIAFPLGVVASHQFSDVPTSNPYHADIDALVDNGITNGCGGGEYCPTDYVTRAQMAAFMNRLGALGGGKTPVVNADRVDSRDASDLTRFAYAPESSTLALPEIPASIVYGSVTITAPTAGYVLVTGSASVQSLGCTGICDAYGRVHHVGTLNGSQYSIDTPSATGYSALSWSVVFPVTAGPQTFEIELSRAPGGTGMLNGYFADLTAQFSPFDGTGGTTSGVSVETGESPTSPIKSTPAE